MKSGAHVLLRDEHAEVWRGPLRALLRDNGMDRESARGLVVQLRRYGNALIGGGAAGAFTVELDGGADTVPSRGQYRATESVPDRAEVIELRRIAPDSPVLRYFSGGAS